MILQNLWQYLGIATLSKKVHSAQKICPFAEDSSSR